jgi:flavorubredoxin
MTIFKPHLILARFAGPNPLAAYCAFLANALRPKTKFLSIIGSYGWGGKTVFLCIFLFLT